MELHDAIARRRMVRAYDSSRAVPAETLTRVLSVVNRAPSAGFSQGCDLVVLTGPADTGKFWSATAGEGADNSWLRGMRTAPVLVLVCADREAYLTRYAEPDKGWTDRDEARWPVPYWDVDAGMAAMLVLLAAEDAGLGACFFGVPGEAWDAVRAAFGIPADRRLVGAISLGYPDRVTTGPPGSPSRRPRRPAQDQLHHGRW